MALNGASLLHFNLCNGFQADSSKVAIMLQLLQNPIQMAHWQAGVEPDTIWQKTLK